jgi:hypothetical protein
LSLSEGFLISLESIQSLISLHRNDLSRSIVSLNYWATSGGVGAYGQKELLRVSDELPEADCQKLEKAIFNSAKPAMSLDELESMSGCPLTFVGLSECRSRENVFDSPSDLKTLFDNGFVDLFEFNFIDLMPFPRVPRPTLQGNLIFLSPLTDTETLQFKDLVNVQ